MNKVLFDRSAEEPDWKWPTAPKPQAPKKRRRGFTGMRARTRFQPITHAEEAELLSYPVNARALWFAVLVRALDDAAPSKHDTSPFSPRRNLCQHCEARHWLLQPGGLAEAVYDILGYSQRWFRTKLRRFLDDPDMTMRLPYMAEMDKVRPYPIDDDLRPPDGTVADLLDEWKLFHGRGGSTRFFKRQSDETRDVAAVVSNERRWHKIDPARFDDMRDFRARGARVKDVAKHYGISQPHASHIIHGWERSTPYDDRLTPTTTNATVVVEEMNEKTS